MGEDQDIKDSILSVILSVILILIPFGFMKFLYRNFSKLKEQEFEAKFGSLYLGLQTKDKYFLHYLSFFMIRRFILAALIAFLDSQPCFQVMLQYLITSICSAYFASAFPYDNRQQNIIDFYNEITIQILSLMLFPLSMGENLDIETRWGIGWFMVAITLLNVAINYLTLFIAILSSIWAIIKKVIQKVKDKRAIKQHQESQFNEIVNLNNSTKLNQSNFALEKTLETTQIIEDPKQTNKKQYSRSQNQEQFEKFKNSSKNTSLIEETQKINLNKSFKHSLFQPDKLKGAVIEIIPKSKKKQKTHKNKKNKKKKNKKTKNRPDDYQERFDETLQTQSIVSKKENDINNNLEEKANNVKKDKSLIRNSEEFIYVQDYILL